MKHKRNVRSRQGDLFTQLEVERWHNSQQPEFNAMTTKKKGKQLSLELVPMPKPTIDPFGTVAEFEKWEREQDQKPA